MANEEEKDVERIRPKINFYQNDEYVFCEVMVRNIRPGHATIKFRERELSFIYLQQRTPEDPTVKEALYELYIDLADLIVPEDSSYQISPMKATIKLKKATVGGRWERLELPRNEEEATKTKQQQQPTMATTTTTTTTAAAATTAAIPEAVNKVPKKTQPDWESLVREVEKEEEDDELGSVETAFQRIYKNASEEGRRAMLKSMIESKGTVLSTDWKQVGSAKVEPQYGRDND